MFMLSIAMLAAASFAPWGKDAEMARKPAKKETIARHPIKQGAIALIQFFQKQISPIDGPRSSFIPTSSQYTKLAIERYGLLGFFLGSDRLLRENKESWIWAVKETELGIRKLDPIPDIKSFTTR